MIADYHIHTGLCPHAEGEPREYVERAIGLGMSEMGFADHLPFLGGWEPRHDAHRRLGHGPRRARRLRLAGAGPRAASTPPTCASCVGIEADYIEETLDETAEMLGELPVRLRDRLRPHRRRALRLRPSGDARRTCPSTASSASSSRASSWPNARPPAASSTSSGTSTTRRSSAPGRATKRPWRPPRPRRCAPWRRPASRSSSTRPGCASRSAKPTRRPTCSPRPAPSASR